MNELKDQILVFKIALDIGKRQIEQLEKELNNKKFEDRSLEDKKKTLRIEGVYLYFKNFWGLYEFLCKKIEVEDSKDIHFYIPFLRTLTELYGETMYLLNQDTRTTIGLFVGNALFEYSGNYISIFKSDILEKEYNRYHLLVKDVLDSENIKFPDRIEDLTKEYLGNKGFNFPKYGKIFTKSYFSDNSKETFSTWPKDTSSNFYEKYYKVHSSYTHRRFMNQTSVQIGTEIFWIGQFMFIIAQLILELSNLKIFDHLYRSDYEVFLTKIGEAEKNMNIAWKNKPRQTK